MTTIIVHPKSKDEKDLITRILRKMNIEASIVEEPLPNYETKKAISDVEQKKGTRVKNSGELFRQLGI
jgi:hypothetical protein